MYEGTDSEMDFTVYGEDLSGDPVKALTEHNGLESATYTVRLKSGRTELRGRIDGNVVFSMDYDHCP